VSGGDGTRHSSNTLKERFSLAYIHAVAARAGFELLEPRIDIDSVDGILRSTSGRRPQIDFQAKATSQPLLQSQGLTFPLPIKNYHDLRAETINPRILIVVVLPADEGDWMAQDEDKMVLRRCGYWVSLRGLSETANVASVSVELPRTQIFDTKQLQDMMARAAIGPEI
jgi:Domain of unknown function (DUF4365)